MGSERLTWSMESGGSESHWVLVKRMLGLVKGLSSLAVPDQTEPKLKNGLWVDKGIILSRSA